MSATVTDRNAVARAEIRWSVVFSGQPVSSTTGLALEGDTATGSFSFGPDLVEPNEPAVMELILWAIDTHGNTSEAGPITITILHCDLAEDGAPAALERVDLFRQAGVLARERTLFVR